MAALPATSDAAPRFIHRLQYGLVLAVAQLVRALPWQTSQTLGRVAGQLFHWSDARHRRVVRQNLRGADLGLDEKAIRALARACFEHFGTLLFTTLRLLSMSPEEVRRITRIEGREHFEAALAEGRGAIGLTGHFGNWELMALAISLELQGMAVVGRALDNPLLEAVLRDFRCRFGNSVIPKHGAVLGSVKALREGKLVGMLLDQDAGANGVFVKFLGRWASTFPTAGMLATRLDIPVLPIFSRVHRDGTITVTIYPSFHAPRTGDPARDAWTATQFMTAWIEAQVWESPSQWFWMHRRFKTQPGPGEPDLPPREWLETAFPGCSRY
jgi:KDO2-lipid IV(A) lauroyltransferase